MTDLRAAVRDAMTRLAAAGVASPETDAVALAAHLLGVSPGDVRKAMVLGAAVPAAYAELVEERAARVPLQHLTGRAGFRRLELSVGPGVFVPRPETELAAGLAIEAARGLAAPVVVDLCTGSGAIALAVKDEVPHARVYAVELGEDAHAWAARNVADTRLEVDLRQGDATVAFPELDGTVDVVVSNPPYIPVGMVPLDPEVRDHDPELALYGGSEDGLRIPLAVAGRASRLLRAGGMLVMEHADTQGETLPAALRRTGEWVAVIDHVDLAGRPRATTARRA
ncbi:peptide chain release factor N(5)-glutamine methyltransferase [Nostocoides sp. HKS02]|uniref:peptide chain release factor N(5)-glutamine methyltransferase n=1 Tax=Nostocoides sp. HKS02 TaxID=1813880 RepID=UPI0012B4E729|nr:peptide chain release factor N(5)-glutamine methyltransferase [Tetrasphaera sp. HKS02]QGN57920.1 peptide chain release factor N(5)-glutamine methyltransferase [Tetrasphaera sp. HKS02]